MIKTPIKILIALFSTLFITACDSTDSEITPAAYTPNWTESTKLVLTPKADATGKTPKAFQLQINSKTGAVSWTVSSLKYGIGIVSPNIANTDIRSIELFAFAEEKVNNQYKYIGGTDGKLLATVTGLTASSEISFTKDQLYNLFKTELSSVFTELNSDIFIEFKWRITAKNGQILDTRYNCNGFNCSTGVKTESVYYDPTWIGNFQYKWILIGPGTVTYSYRKVGTNPVGPVIFASSKTVDKAFDVDDLSFGGGYKATPGYIIFDSSTNTLNVYNSTTEASKWELVGQTPQTLTVKWTYRYTAQYNEYGTVELTRADGITWPANLKIVNK